MIIIIRNINCSAVQWRQSPAQTITKCVIFFASHRTTCSKTNLIPDNPSLSVRVCSRFITWSKPILTDGLIYVDDTVCLPACWSLQVSYTAVRNITSHLVVRAEWNIMSDRWKRTHRKIRYSDVIVFKYAVFGGRKAFPCFSGSTRFVKAGWSIMNAGYISPMIPLSLLSSVELGLVIVPQGLLRLRMGRLVVLLSVEHGLSVLGDAVLLVRVEHGLMPWLAAEHWRKRKKGKKVGEQLHFDDEAWSQLNIQR